MFSAQDNSLLDDPKYRQYISVIDKALKNFESSSEWADLISALGKLHKVLNPKYKVIPKSVTVGKRLAQCLHPALPGGVHLKALQVYDYIFSIIKKKRLQADLYIYSSGIFPLLANASMQVRPVLLNLYETHILPLGRSLNICLDGIVVGLLPGLEEGTEYFDRVDSLLKKLCDSVGNIEFYSAIWRSILCSSNARLPALQFVLRRFDKKLSTDNQLHIIGSDINVMVRALRESFHDSSILTQRASFDVLIFICPFSSLSVPKEDCVTVLMAAVQCILRRDMSLNRRLYSWLLGFDQSKHHDSSTSVEQDGVSYFEMHSKTLLIKACKSILSQQKQYIVTTWKTSNNVSADDLFPLKLLVNLLDKAEIGQFIIDDVLIEVFRLLDVVYSRLSLVETGLEKNAKLSEVTKTINLLLDVFEPGYIWQYLVALLESDALCESNHKPVYSEVLVSFPDVCGFIQLFLNIIRRNHLPNVLFHVIDFVIKTSPIDHCIHNISCGLTTCSKLLDSCQPSQPEEFPTMGNSPNHNGNTDKLENISNEHSVPDCSHHFHDFLCMFVMTFLNGSRSNIDKCLAQLETFQAVRDMGSHKPPGNHIKTPSGKLSQDKNKVQPLDNGSLSWSILHETFELSCRLLLDFACFPVYFEGKSSPNIVHNTNMENISFPSWLNSLLFVSCWSGGHYPLWFKFSSCAISTILDLISLSQTVSASAERSGFGKASGTVSVVVLSPMSSMHVMMLYNESSFFQLISKEMWKMIGEDSEWANHLICVQLLVRLHTMCNDTRCEDVLLEDIFHHDQDIRTRSIFKFCRIWDINRTLAKKSIALHSEGHFRTFNRCLFAVVDTLTSYNVERTTLTSPVFQPTDSTFSLSLTIVHRWLRQCLEKQDLLRLLEPFLLVALHPKTRSAPFVAGVESDDVSNVEVGLPQASSQQLTNLTYKLRNSFNEATSSSSVLSDIAKGKQQYRDLVSKLTERSEDEISSKAQHIVETVIREALEVIRLKTSPMPQDEAAAPASAEELEKTKKITQQDGKTPDKQTSWDLLIYQESFDTRRVLYVLRSILALLHCNPRLFTYTASTTQMSHQTSYLAGQSTLQELLVRHQQSMAGKQFYGDISSQSQSIMIIDVLIGICLRYIRSWQPPKDEIPNSLCDVRCISCKLLVSLLDQVTILAKENVTSASHLTSSTVSSSAQQFSAFVMSVLVKHRMQETALLALSRTVQALHVIAEGCTSSTHCSNTRGSPHSCENNAELAYWWCGNNRPFIVSFQANLLHLLRSIISFEHRCTEIDPTRARGDFSTKRTEENPPTYLHNLSLTLQPSLLHSIIKMLRLQSASVLHSDWLDFVTSSLPHMSRALPGMLTPLTLQICRNMETAVNCYVISTAEVASNEGGFPVDYVTSLLRSLRTLIHSTLLLPVSGVTSLVVGLSSSTDRKPSLLATANPVQASQTSTSLGFSALGSLFNVFSSNNTLRPQHSVDDHELTEEAAEAKKISLNNLPRILSCLASIWNITANSSRQNPTTPPGGHAFVTMGDEESIAQTVLQLLNPIALQYGENLFHALAVVWERRGRSPTGAKPLREPNDQQLQLVDVTCSIRSLQCDVIMTLVKRVVAQPPDYPALLNSKKRQTPNEECLLEFVLRYVQRQIPALLRGSRSAMLTLVRECLAQGTPGSHMTTVDTASTLSSTAPPSGKRQLGANCYFLLLQLLAEYAKSAHSSNDKKELKEMQDVTIKCIDSCNAIVDCSLEHGGWLVRKAPTVLPASQHDVQSPQNRIESGSSVDLLDPHQGKEDSGLKPASSDPGIAVTGRISPNPQQPQPSMTILPQKANPNYEHSVNALRVLAQHLANLLDLVFGSEEKDKMIPLLTTVMTNVSPYLRNHCLNFAPSYRAAVSLLSSVSGFQQTRRSWKRDAFELLLEPGFFKMPHDSIHEWMNVIDHLMTHDATTFKDLMVRIGLTRNTTTGTSLNIFSNKEQELEQRAMLLKRLAFVIFSSGVNQYQRHLPEIQERLSESLRLHLVPAVQAEVFLCFRVMLVRLSPQHLISLWPTIITELIQVLGQMEQEVTLHDYDRDLEEAKDGSVKDKTSLASSRVGVLFSTPTSSTSRMYLQEKWMAMYLSACKLLDLALILQPNQLNYFKMFRWSFVGEPGDSTEDETLERKVERKEVEARGGGRKNHDAKHVFPFVPHCIRINRVMSAKFNDSLDMLEAAPLRPLLDIRKLRSLFELKAFFNTIISPDTMLRILPTKKTTNGVAGLLSSPSIEEVLRNDFVEEMI